MDHFIYVILALKHLPLRSSYKVIKEMHIVEKRTAKYVKSYSHEGCQEPNRGGGHMETQMLVFDIKKL